MAEWLQKQWYKNSFWYFLTLPVSWFFAMLIGIRRFCYECGLLKTFRLPVPVIVVGNLSVGGTGKTPFVIWLAERLATAGYKPGIISRGYGGKARQLMFVTPDSPVELVGDEPSLLAVRTRCPICISPDRVAAGKALLDKFPQCDILISDDGLQHYRLRRDIEVVIFDAERVFGNGALLPAGPLREPKSRLNSVDFIVSNGNTPLSHVGGIQVSQMQFESSSFYNLSKPERQEAVSFFSNKKVKAVAGIGNPQRFFDTLSDIGLVFEAIAYPDHYLYQAADFADKHSDIVVMTEKDAVKCKAFATSAFWVLPVNAALDERLFQAILDKLKLNQLAPGKLTR